MRAAWQPSNAAGCWHGSHHRQVSHPAQRVRVHAMAVYIGAMSSLACVLRPPRQRRYKSRILVKLAVTCNHVISTPLYPCSLFSAITDAYATPQRALVIVHYCKEGREVASFLLLVPPRRTFITPFRGRPWAAPTCQPRVTPTPTTCVPRLRVPSTLTDSLLIMHDVPASVVMSGGSLWPFYVACVVLGGPSARCCLLCELLQ